MNKLLNLFYVMLISIIISACGSQNNISLITTLGTCADGTTSAPYCMGIQISNNNESGAQNWINSVNYPIKNIAISVSGTNNASYPGNGSVNQDPNGCLNATIGPGSTCTFYLQLNTESYAVGSQTPMDITVSYDVNNTWTGSGGSTGSNSLTVHQQSNLYGITTAGILNTYAYAGTSQVATESASQTYSSLQTLAMDNNSYGLIYTSNQTGIFTFGNTTDKDGNTNYLSTNVFESSTTSNIGNFGNLFSNSSLIYAATSGYGIWQNSLNGTTSWSQLNSASTEFLQNVNTISSLGSIYLVANTGNQVYLCVTSSTSSILNCSTEASQRTDIINDIGVSATNFSGYTGLYVATNTGFFAESGSSSSNTNSWTQVTQSVDGATVPAINVITSDGSGNVYAGDINGNIWKISNTATNATVASLTYANIGSNSSIIQMTVDNPGNQLLVLNNNNELYSCSLSSNTCTQLSTTFDSGVVNLGIGSQLTD